VVSCLLHSRWLFDLFLPFAINKCVSVYHVSPTTTSVTCQPPFSKCHSVTMHKHAKLC